MKKELGIAYINDSSSESMGLAFHRSTGLLGFKDIASLPNDIVWITNLKKTDNHHLKNSEFFYYNIDYIVSILGYFNDGDFTITLKNIYLFINKVSHIFDDNYGLVNYLDGESSSDSLSGVLDYNVTKTDKIFNKIPVDESIYSFGDNYLDTVGNLRIYYPKYQYVKKICQIKIPTGDWKILPDRDIKEINTDPEAIISKLSERHSFLVKLKILKFNDDIGDIAALTGLPLNASSKYTWVTNDIALFFAKYSKINITNVYISNNEYINKHENSMLFKANKIEKRTFHVGVASMIYLDMLTKNNKFLYPSIWFRSYEKILNYTLLLYFNLRGYNLKMIRGGEFCLDYSSMQELEKITEIANSIGLEYKPENIKV
jgi:hypothetical protein